MSARAFDAQQRLVPAWECQSCRQDCLPVRSESRCICGHRLKAHSQETSGADDPFRCTQADCGCPSFFYIAAEGSWILRCRCKHKHVEHDPSSHVCTRSGCDCGRFFSPWVCNCGHPWSDHDTVLRRTAVTDRLAQVARAANVDPALLLADTAQSGAADWSSLKRGL